MPVLLPSAWLRAPTRVAGERDGARSEPPRRVSGLLSTSVLATFDWRLAVGDVGAHRRGAARARGGEEPGRAGRRPLAGGARRRREARAAVPRAPPQRRRLRRARARGVGPRDRRGGARAGDGAARPPLDELLSGKDARFRPRGRRRGCGTTCSRSRRRGTGGCGCSAISGSARSWPTTWGSGRRCRRSRCSCRSARRPGAEAFGPTLVVCPMSVARQWVAEVASLRAGAARASPSRQRPAAGRGAAPQGARGRRGRHVVRHRDARRRGARARSTGTG